ncbi:hypothetical protein SeLEV6574_g03423, partial [Synchytrium endobioticum]
MDKISDATPTTGPPLATTVFNPYAHHILITMRTRKSGILVRIFLLAVAAAVHGQLSGPVGPSTPLSQKTHICNILDYGAATNTSDIGPAILSAFTDCVKQTPGSTLYVPPGTYNMSTWVKLENASNWAFQIDG